MSNFLGYGSPEDLEAAIRKEEGDDFEVYSEGLVYASVCSSLPEQEVVARMRRRISGTKGGWVMAAGGFADGTANPHPCDRKPDTHRHYLFSC